MKIIKLDAIDSTNSFLKELVQHYPRENFTVVVTKSQTNGRGQHNTKWVSEPFKNLTFSVFINTIELKIKDQKYLNFVISLAVYQVILELGIKNVSIKWPNDIMAGNRKICGLLIENTIFKDAIKATIAGIGLNVNQTQFPEHLTNVTSLKNNTNLDYDLDALLNKMLTQIHKNIASLREGNYIQIEKQYLTVLYKKDKTAAFKDLNDKIFIGIIRTISEYGNLLIELEDGSLKEFGLKEVSFA